MANKATSIISNINSGTYDSTFKKLYVDEEIIPEEKNRYIRAIESFIELYGDLDIEIYSAPGRSEIGGNHTDHQRGKVLATSVNIDVIAVCSPSGDDTVDFKSEGYPAIKVDISNPTIKEELFGTTESLISGVAASFKKRGLKASGFKGYATSQVLAGSGLSSSAAIEILFGQIFSGLFNNSVMDAVSLAIIGKEAENEFFGKPSGLMDQMACSVGGLIHIDFKDPSNPVVEKIDIDFETFEHSLCIVDTKGSHADLTDDYAMVTREMKAVSQFFNKEFLSEISKEDFFKAIPALKEKVTDRAIIRAIHFYDDNAIVDLEVKALSDSDFSEFKKLIIQSGNSSFKHLQNVYSPKNPTEQGIPLALAVTEKLLDNAGAFRVHGGGFAGTIQVFVPNGKVNFYKEEIEKIFGEDSCQVLRIRNIGGCKVL